MNLMRPIPKYYDTIFVGGGINALVCALTLAEAGQQVAILERRPKPGGCVDTEEATRPGFQHDMMAMSWPLFVSAPFFPRWETALRDKGVRFVTAPFPTASILPDGRNLILATSRAENIARFNAASPGDGEAYAAETAEFENHSDVVFSLLGHAPLGREAALAIYRSVRQHGIGGTRALGGTLLEPMCNWLERNFHSDLVRALLAPWILHAGQSPAEPLSATIGKAILLSIESVGMPIVAGGGDTLVRALVSMITGHGGHLICNADVAHILSDRKRASGVQLSDGRQFRAPRIVCDLTPTQLYGRLLAGEKRIPPIARQHAARYRYGRSCMMIHLALDAPPEWTTPDLGKVALVHLTAGLESVLRATGEAERGLLPAEGTIVVGQPTNADPGRCPEGRSMLWIQILELPAFPHGDAAGLLTSLCTGHWTPELADAYADRILHRLERHIPGIRSKILAQAVLSPTDLAARNINLVNGDPYSGTCSIDQFHVNRGIPEETNYRTPLPGLWRIGASTHPGAGLGGMSGFLAAEKILSTRTLLGRLRGR